VVDYFEVTRLMVDYLDAMVQIEDCFYPVMVLVVD